MTNTTKLFDLGGLAEAAYADFTGVDSSFNAGQIIDRLTTGDSEFSTAQATEFASHWKVVHHQTNTSGIGFSATLFQRIDNDPITGYQAGQYVYAIRGTEGFTSNDLWQEDIGNIVIDGLAIDQIVDMYNDWKRITAGAGNTYDAAQLVTDTVLTIARAALPLGGSIAYDLLLGSQGYIIDQPTGLVRKIEIHSSDVVFGASNKWGQTRYSQPSCSTNQYPCGLMSITIMMLVYVLCIGFCSISLNINNNFVIIAPLN